MTSMILGRDINGIVSHSISFGDGVSDFSMLLALDVAQIVTIPSYAKEYDVIFSYEPGGEVWVAKNAIAAYPVGAVAITSSHQNPVARQVKAGDTLSFITPNTAVRCGVIIRATRY